MVAAKTTELLQQAAPQKRTLYPAMNAPPNASAPEKLIPVRPKQHRAAARAQALGEALSAIDTYFSTVKKNDDDPVWEMYQQLRGEVEKLLTTEQSEPRKPGRPLGSKNKAKTTGAMPKLNVSIPHYYIGEDEEGNRSSFKTATIPNKETHGKDFAHVYGPFRFAKSVAYRLNKTNEELAKENAVMSVVY